MGNSEAAHNLGFMYRYGIKGVVEKNIEKAMEFYEKSSKMGSVKGTSTLSDIYRHGREGVKKDVVKTIKAYERGVELGDLNSMRSLAYIYKYGEMGIKPDTQKAIKYFQKAADIGHRDSMVRLTSLYVDSICDIEFAAAYKLKWCLLYGHFSEIKKFLSMYQVEWRTEYNPYWGLKSESTNRIVMLLLISKHRNHQSSVTTKNVTIKGIIMTVIKYLCRLEKISII